MPINLSYIEPRIYRAEWQGAVTIEEVILSTPPFNAMVAEHGEDDVVLLIDMSTNTRLPFDIHNLRNSADSDNHVICYVIVQAPAVGKMLGRMVDKLASNSFRFADTLEEGVEQARQFLGTDSDVSVR